MKIKTWGSIFKCSFNEFSEDKVLRLSAALSYYSLGADAERNADSYLKDYYAFLGEDLAGMIAGSAAKDADTVKQYAAAFEQAGADELIFFPSSSEPEQVDLLVDAAGI